MEFFLREIFNTVEVGDKSYPIISVLIEKCSSKNNKILVSMIRKKLTFYKKKLLEVYVFIGDTISTNLKSFFFLLLKTVGIMKDFKQRGFKINLLI